MSNLKLSAVKFGLACGIISALIIGLTTMGVLLGYEESAAGFIQNIYGFVGYSISWLGALLGAVYGFVDGFILAWLFALIYNRLVGK